MKKGQHNPMQEDRTETFSGTFRIHDDVYRAMNEEAEQKPKRETGGMLFGSFDGSGDSLVVSVERVDLIPDEAAQRSAAHFGIDPNYSDQVLDQYCPEFTYLGNWHSHLNYGGPSQGDYQQVSRFFETNPNREYMIAAILDRRQLNPPNFELIAEVYQRASGGTTGEGDFITRRIKAAFLYDRDSEYDPDHRLGSLVAEFDIRRSLTKRLEGLADLIAETTPVHANHEDALVYLDRGGSVDEVVLCLPLRYRNEEGQFIPLEDSPSERDDGADKADGGSGDDDLAREAPDNEYQSGSDPEGRGENADEGVENDELVEQGVEADDGPNLVDIYLTVSVPLVYPDDDIYVDLASQDLTKQLTILTTESAVLQDSTSEFASELYRLASERIPKLLISPLSKIIGSDET